ncbi:MAG: RuvX/YqgF family protein, partial [Clostridiales bacterium]|nr:RuvX/YqgF family protein [Clostridiales bacterium]
LSTVSAHKVMIQGDVSRKKRKERVDQVAAVLILQNYLDYLSQR